MKNIDKVQFTALDILTFHSDILLRFQMNRFAPDGSKMSDDNIEYLRVLFDSLCLILEKSDLPDKLQDIFVANNKIMDELWHDLEGVPAEDAPDLVAEDDVNAPEVNDIQPSPEED